MAIDTWLNGLHIPSRTVRRDLARSSPLLLALILLDAKVKHPRRKSCASPPNAQKPTRAQIAKPAAHAPGVRTLPQRRHVPMLADLRALRPEAPGDPTKVRRIALSEEPKRVSDWTAIHGTKPLRLCQGRSVLAFPNSARMDRNGRGLPAVQATSLLGPDHVTLCAEEFCGTR